jgi:NAD(P)-dependent dehydrogenase (short-subunit alcohol dehydrogenase family)
MTDLSNRVVVITGAIGNLGTATAHAFKAIGARTVLVDRSVDRLRQSFPTLVDSSDHLLTGGVDLTDAESVVNLIEKARGRFGRVDVLVNTVGGYRGGKPVHEDDLANWDFLFDINLRTTLHCCRAVIPHMLRQEGGKIINVASRGALAGDGGLSAYSASKSAVLRLTESLADELKRAGINVNCVLPGTIDTPQNRQAMPSANHANWVQPAAIADVIVFLASNAARGINGAAIPVFGRA